MESEGLTEAMLRFMKLAVAEALEHEDPERFRQWVAEALPGAGVLPDEAVDPALLRAIATIFARRMWNALPLPGNGLRPRPLPEPGRNDRCPCGAVAKYKRCCGRFHGQSIESLEVGELMPLVLDQLPAERRRALLAGPALPLAQRAILAADELDEGRHRRAIECLLPLFATAIERPTDDHVYAMHVLVDAYFESRQHKKAQHLLESVIATNRPSVLRAQAQIRLADHMASNIECERARELLLEAAAFDPEGRGRAMAEVKLLLAELRFEDAHKYARRAVPRLYRDPFGTFEAQQIEQLLARVAEESARRLDDDDGGGDGPEDFAAWMAPLQRPLPRHAARPDGIEDDRATTGRGVLLVPPDEVAAIEAQWRECFPDPKPFSTQLEPMGESQAWEPARQRRWLALLEQHPAAFDSIDILDDLGTALFTLPARPEMLALIFERATRIVEHALAEVPNAILRWPISDNRPALRCLAHFYSVSRQLGEHARANRLAERLLQLNPDDNHGMRSVVINALLQRNDNAAALALADRYPDDVLADIVFGRILALLRTDQRNLAAAAMRSASSLRSQVPRYLLAARIRRPKSESRYGLILGGDEEAWLYREQMRGAWQHTPGALEWLATAVGRPKPGPRRTSKPRGQAAGDDDAE